VVVQGIHLGVGCEDVGWYRLGARCQRRNIRWVCVSDRVQS